jgi:hypothetical protein
VVRRILWFASGVALLVAGAAVVGTTRSAVDFGGFAYVPLENGVQVIGGTVLLSRTQVIGLLVGVLGLMVLTSGAGYLVGQRRRR